MSTHTLPSVNVNQEWAHSTCTIAEMNDAIKSNVVTAVEADILMGTDSTRGSAGLQQPIMAHPPSRESDLSFHRFMKLAISDGALRKHLKLDFKEIETVRPCLDIIRQFGKFIADNKSTIFLNADILPGPGRSLSDIAVPADHFLGQTVAFLSAMTAGNFVFSLGFKVDVCSVFGYTDKQLASMSNLIRTHHLDQGIVLAVNARLLVKNMQPFESFLDQFPASQILCWTGSGEPPISRTKMNVIRKHFELHGSINRVGFDVQVRHMLVLGSVMTLYGANISFPYRYAQYFALHA